MLEPQRVREAADRLAGLVHHTPLVGSTLLGQSIGVRLHLKCECLQKTGSFKARGALNKVLTLTEEERKSGLITVSAGNHAQAVAWAARQVGASCAVVMPIGAPRSKIDAVEGYGAEVVLHPERATLFDRLHQERDDRGAVFIHPFDDPAVLAGAGTVGSEIVEDLPDVDAVFVPVGGGGLLGGVSTIIKDTRPETRVIGVELEAGPGMKPALEAGKPIPVARPETLADGMTPPFVGALPLAIARESVDELVGVSEAEIRSTMGLLMTRCKYVVEASGAAATAAVLHRKVDMPAQSRVVAVISGGNLDLEQIAEIVT